MYGNSKRRLRRKEQQLKELGAKVKKENAVKKYLREKLAIFYTPPENNCPYTNMATCTYTVAAVFLYYITCSFIFFYVARTTGPLVLLRSFVEQSFDLGKLRDSLRLISLTASALIV